MLFALAEIASAQEPAEQTPPAPPETTATPEATPAPEAAPVPEPATTPETTDTPQVTATPGEPGPMEVCEQVQPGDETMLERVRRGLTQTACASSAWLDSLFGDQILYDEYRSTYGTISAGALWSEYDGFDPRLRFRVRLQLPQWDERISAFAGRVGTDDYISDTEQDFQALPTRTFGNLEDDSVLVGLGYSNPERTGNDFDAGVGVRVDLPLDPYARVRYEIVRAFGEHYVLTARETVFWQTRKASAQRRASTWIAPSPKNCCCAGATSASGPRKRPASNGIRSSHCFSASTRAPAWRGRRRSTGKRTTRWS